MLDQRLCSPSFNRRCRVELALVFLRERLSRAQLAGLLGAGAAIALVSLG